MLTDEARDKVLALARRDAASAESAIRLAQMGHGLEVDLLRFQLWKDRATALVAELEREL